MHYGFTKHQLGHVTLLFKWFPSKGFPITYRLKPKTFTLVCTRLFTVSLQTPFQPPAPRRCIIPKCSIPSTFSRALLSTWKVLLHLLSYFKINVHLFSESIPKTEEAHPLIPFLPQQFLHSATTALVTVASSYTCTSISPTRLYSLPKQWPSSSLLCSYLSNKS